MNSDRREVQFADTRAVAPGGPAVAQMHFTPGADRDDHPPPLGCSVTCGTRPMSPAATVRPHVGRNATSASYDHDLPRAALADRVPTNDGTGLGTALEVRRVRSATGSSAVVGGPHRDAAIDDTDSKGDLARRSRAMAARPGLPLSLPAQPPAPRCRRHQRRDRARARVRAALPA